MPKHSERGQILLMMTLATPLVFGGLALAIDVGWAYYRREVSQAAADGAALAAARAAMRSASGNYTCGSNGVWCGAATTCPTTPVASPTTSFDNACMMASANGLSGQTVTVQANNTASVPTVSGPSVDYWVTVRVYHAGSRLFAGVVPGTGN